MKKSLMLSLLLFSSLLASAQGSFWDTYTAALRGDADAQYRSGVMFEQGIGTDVNQSMAAKWYEKAAMQGHKDAQFNLGIMYAAGRGIEKNTQFAMMWLASAAAQGDKEAHKLLNYIIEGKLDSKPLPGINSSTDSSGMSPVRFEVKESGKICAHPRSDSRCVWVDKNQRSYTSNQKNNGYYKITGMVTTQGWKSYDKEGWIEENSVEIRH